MGGPMSSIIAEAFIDRLERWVLSTSRFSSNVILWYRYVDDILCLWRGSDEDLRKFHCHLHSFDKNITFTVELGDRQINYLDLTIKLCHDDVNDGLLTPTFSVYRKPTYSGLSIHIKSWHPPTHKYAVIRSSVHRMLSLPLSSEAEEMETRIIERIATINGLDTNVRLYIKKQKLHRLLNESRSSPLFQDFSERNYGAFRPPPSVKPRETWLRLPFLGKPTVDLVKALKPYGYRIGFYPVTKVLALSSLKDKASSLNKSGIYSLVCSCGDKYIGHTGRTITKRFQEHRSAYNRSLKMIPPPPHFDPQYGSAVAQHCLESGHSFNAVRPSLLHPCENGTRIDRLEEIYTLRSLQESSLIDFNVLNDMTAVYNNSFIRYMLQSN